MRGFLVALCAVWTAPAFAQESWPRLEGGAGIPGCTHALEIARSSFRSSSFEIDDLRPVTPDGASIILSVGDDGAYGDDGIIADAQTFEILPATREGWRMHWARAAQGGQRLVVRDGEHSWRGYNYDALAIPEAMSQQELVPALREESSYALGYTTWVPPIVVRDDATGALAVIRIDIGALPPWEVFAQTGQRYEQTCTVRFQPELGPGQSLLPRPVRVFAQRIDATLGDGRDEGTLQPTGRIRFQLAKTWANAMQRPWALTAAPYNSRAEVDENLRRWSRQAPSFRVAYNALLAQYPRAERALAAYYVERFGLTPEQAREMAAYVTDVAFRSAYVFPGGSRVEVSNPWPDSVPRQ